MCGVHNGLVCARRWPIEPSLVCLMCSCSRVVALCKCVTCKFKHSLGAAASALGTDCTSASLGQRVLRLASWCISGASATESLRYEMFGFVAAQAHGNGQRAGKAIGELACV